MRKILEQERVGKFISKSIISYPIFLFFSSLFRSYKRVYLYTLVFLDANLSISRKNSQILILHRIFDSIQHYNGPPPMSSPKKLIRSGNIQMQQTITFLHSTSRIYFQMCILHIYIYTTIYIFECTFVGPYNSSKTLPAHSV